MRRFPFATLALAALLVVTYGAELSAGVEPLCLAKGFDPSHPTLASAVVSLFLHASVSHLAGNVATLAVFGAVVESEIGGLGLLALFVVSGLGAAAMHWLVDPNSATPLVGCSGCVFGLMALAGVLRPRLVGFVLALGALNVVHAFMGGDGAVSFGAHLGGLVVGTVVAFARFARFGSLARA